MHNSHAGFTLIELLIVAGLALLITGIGIANFIRFNERQQLESVGRKVQSMFHTARAKSQIREVPSSCAKLIGYKVSKVTSQAPVSTSEFTLSVVCDGDDGAGNSESLLDSYIIPSRYTVSGSFDNITYLPLGEGVSSSTPLSEKTIVIGEGENSYTFTLSISESGNIGEGSIERD